jgi:hypothetical protein
VTALSSGTAMLKSATSPGVSAKATGRPRSSARQWIFEVRPPRERPDRLRPLPPFCAGCRAVRLHMRTVARPSSRGTSPEAAICSNRRCQSPRCDHLLYFATAGGSQAALRHQSAHVNSWFGATPCRRATRLTVMPGSKVSSTMRTFSDALQRRLR